MNRPLHVALLAVLALLAGVVLVPVPATADHGCDDRGAADSSQACDAGAQLIATQTEVAFDDLDGAFGHLGFSGPQASELSKLGVPVPNPQRFRYATDIEGEATIDLDWTRLTSHGVAEVEFGVNSLVGMGGFNCNTLENDYRSFCANDAPQTGVTYTAFFSTYGDKFPVDDTGGLSVNLSWPTTIDGKTNWLARGDFVGDTWQGASYIPYITYGPNPWALDVSSVDGNGDLVDEPNSQAFGLIGGNSSLLFVPTNELMQGNQTWDGFRFGVALHVHDGRFGSCIDCPSVVTPYPAFPRDGLIPFAENQIFIADGATVETATPAATPTPSTTPAPTPAPTEAATTTTGGTTTGGGSTDGTTGPSGDGAPADDGGGGVSRVILILVAVAGVGLVVVGVIIVRGGRDRTRVRPPGKPFATKPFQTGTTRTRDGDGEQRSSSAPLAPVSETPTCSCTVSVAIEGTIEYGVCCMQPKLSLKQTEKADAEEMELDPSRVHLDADVEGKDDWDLFDSFYSASITADCSGGGEARVADASYTWSVAEVDGGFEITCKVSVPIDCPDGQEHPPAEDEATLAVSYHTAPCTITVIVERVAWNEISHVDVQIVCGEYNEVFGYFPAGARSFGATIAGAPGQVIRGSTSRASQNRHGWTTGIKDEVGSDYGTSHGSKQLSVYFIEPEDCSVCEKLRDEWEQLSANPGQYYLLTNNCATQAYDTLVTSGAVPLDFEGGPTTPSGMEEHLDDFRGAAEASGVTISEPTEIR